MTNFFKSQAAKKALKITASAFALAILLLALPVLLMFSFPLWGWALFVICKPLGNACSMDEAGPELFFMGVMIIFVILLFFLCRFLAKLTWSSATLVALSVYLLLSPFWISGLIGVGESIAHQKSQQFEESMSFSAYSPSFVPSDFALGRVSNVNASKTGYYRKIVLDYSTLAKTHPGVLGGKLFSIEEEKESQHNQADRCGEHPASDVKVVCTKVTDVAAGSLYKGVRERSPYTSSYYRAAEGTLISLHVTANAISEADAVKVLQSMHIGITNH